MKLRHREIFDSEIEEVDQIKARHVNHDDINNKMLSTTFFLCFVFCVWQGFFSDFLLLLRDSENGQQEHFLLLAIFVFCTK